MTRTPPYYLTGDDGRAMNGTWRTLAELGIHSATITFRSLDVDTLQFTQREKPGRVIAEDGQWISLCNDADGRIFTGIAKRKFIYPQRLWQFEVTNVYQGLLDTPLLDAVTSRPYTLYNSQDLGTTLHAILARAQELGLPIKPPDSAWWLFSAPKMAFRAASCGSAFEDALKWLADAATSMDYSTTPPTLRLLCRMFAPPIVINLDTPGHGCTALDLTAMPEARALCVAFVYAVRDGALLVNYHTQSAGDPAADANRSVSVYLSGHERSEMLVNESLVVSNNAMSAAKASLDAANAAIAASNAAIAASNAAALGNYNTNYNAAITAALAAIPPDPGTFDGTAYVMAHDSVLAAHPTLGWQASQLSWRTLYNGYVYYGQYYGGSTTANYSILQYSSGNQNRCAPGYFSDAQLAAAGATKQSGTLSGDMVVNLGNAANPGLTSSLAGWPSSNYPNAAAADAAWQHWYVQHVSVAVDFLSLSPQVIRQNLINLAYAAVYSPPATLPGSGAGVDTSVFVDHASYVEAPPDLAANYFAHQNWLPYQGTLAFAPSADRVPMPGNFVSLAGGGLPAEFATMATPVAATTIDLATGTATVTLGPPARMTYASIQDRLRIPVEDNYQPG